MVLVLSMLKRSFCILLFMYSPALQQNTLHWVSTELSFFCSSFSASLQYNDYSPIVLVKLQISVSYLFSLLLLSVQEKL